MHRLFRRLLQRQIALPPGLQITLEVLNVGKTGFSQQLFRAPRAASHFSVNDHGFCRVQLCEPTGQFVERDI